MAALLALHAALVLSASGRVGITFDEPYHLVGGLAALTTGDYRMPAAASLSDRWAALPLLFVDDWDLPGEGGSAWTRGEPFQLAFSVLGGREDRRLLYGLARAMTLLLSLALGCLAWSIARRLHGEAGALITLTLYCLSPTILAAAGLVTADLPAALAILAGTWTTWLLLERITPGRLVSGCLTVAAALLTKPSAVALLPIAFVLVLVRLAFGRRTAIRLGRWQPRMTSGRNALALLAVVVLHAIVAVVAAWAVFGFRAEATLDPAAAPAWETRRDRSFGDSGAFGSTLEAIEGRRLLPEALLQSYAYVAQHSERPTFLLGEFSPQGRRLFFPYLFSVKTALGLLLALAVAAAAGLRRSAAGGSSDGPGGAVAIWTLVLVCGGLSVAAGLSIGHRHLLPLYPALCILAGAGQSWLRHRKRALRVLPLLPLALLAAESLLSWPQHLSFFNRLHGGPSQAWRHVAESSLDWGQDLPRLASWLESREGSTPVYLSYFGTDDPWLHGLDAQELYSYHPWTYRHGRARGFLLGPGRYVISATMYRGLVTRPWPPWTDEAEAEYRALRAVVDPAFSPQSSPEQVRALTSDPAWREKYLLLHERRLVRLCRWLQQARPEPDELVAPSLLSWELSREDLQQALFAAPPPRTDEP